MIMEKYYLNLLNNKCPSRNSWVYDEPVFKLNVEKDEVDKITEWVKSVVDCSFFYDNDDDNLTLLFTKSTLEKKLKEKKGLSAKAYSEVKMTRFEKHDHYNGNQVVIVDNLKLARDMHAPCYENGVIFAAATNSQVVNNHICDTILEMLNTEEDMVRLIEYTKEE